MSKLHRLSKDVPLKVYKDEFAKTVSNSFHDSELVVNNTEP